MRFRLRFALPVFAAITFLAAPIAYAAVPTAHAPTLAALDLGNIFSASNIAWAVGTVFSFLIGLSAVGGWLTASRRKLIGFVAHHAFLVVEDANSNGIIHANNKVLAGLKAADDWLAANGFRTLSPREKVAVGLEFKALNGQTVLASPSQPAAK